MASESAAVDAQNQGPTILASCWVLVIVPGIMVALRLWCKLGLSRSGFGLDDVLILLAWVRPRCKFHSLLNPTDNNTVLGTPIGLHSSQHEGSGNGSSRSTRICY